jgi:hypothetical protein
MQKPVAARWMPSLGQTRGVARPTGCGRAHAGGGWQRSRAWARSLRASGGAAARRRGGAAARRRGGAAAEGGARRRLPSHCSGQAHASATVPCQRRRACQRCHAAVSTGAGDTSRLLGLVDSEAHEEHASARAEGLLEQRVVSVEGQVAHEDAARAARLRGGRRWIAMAPSRTWVVAPLLIWAGTRGWGSGSGSGSA